MTETTGRVVYTATHDWWEIVCRDEEIVVGEPWRGRWEEAASAADIDLDDEESWVCVVEEVADRHSRLRPGDYVCCDGCGCDVVFVRL